MCMNMDFKHVYMLVDIELEKLACFAEVPFLWLSASSVDSGSSFLRKQEAERSTAEDRGGDGPVVHGQHVEQWSH